MSFNPSHVLLKASTVDDYSDVFGAPYRWGDFSATMVDPTDPNTFWTIQEVAVGAQIWGTQISAITVAAAVPEPATLGMMFAGLGAIGMALRRRRPALVQC